MVNGYKIGSRRKKNSVVLVRQIMQPELLNIINLYIRVVASGFKYLL